MSDYISNLYQRKYLQQRVHICLPGVSGWLTDLTELIFPVMGQRFFSSEQKLLEAMDNNKQKLLTIFECQTDDPNHDVEADAVAFYNSLEAIEKQLKLDAEFFYESDPACRSVNEVIASYPGFYAIVGYRISHKIFNMGYPLFARMIAENAHAKTGVDIHPGAHIGSPFFIDHATGVVIGETAIIGNRVTLYQGVTIGSLRVTKELSGTKRHPTVEDNCVIYANATILGGETVIGKNSIIGGNVWLSSSVKPNSFVYHESIMTTKERGM